MADNDTPHTQNIPVQAWGFVPNLKPIKKKIKFLILFWKIVWTAAVPIFRN